MIIYNSSEGNSKELFINYVNFYKSPSDHPVSYFITHVKDPIKRFENLQMC